MSSYNRFSYLGSGFLALEYRSPQRTNTPLSYIVQYIYIYTLKLLLVFKGERYSIKLFDKYYKFHIKIDCF